MKEKELVYNKQYRLKELGYYNGLLDGVIGPMTNNAVIDFKENNGLRGRDYVGPVTEALLYSPNVKHKPELPNSSDKPKWLAEAYRLLGAKEVKGPANNPTIMQWAKDLDQWYPGDDVPWCGLFVAHCMAVGAPDEPQNFNRLGARNWLKYGVESAKKNDRPHVGDICVLWRTHPTKSYNGHVFLVTGYDDNAIRGIGGNQSDNVTESWFSHSRVLGYRKPHGTELLPAPKAKQGQFSTNEA